MKRARRWLTIVLSLAWMTAWAAMPTPVVTGDSLSWPAVAASTINVHSGDGAYIQMLAVDDETVTIQLINGTEVEELNQSWVPEWSAWQHILPR